ncbi:hypothetical protein NYE33_11305 [Paenibacillus sp. FSL R10-2199]|uniref:hypothetical protein n=1 Tax=Paenibacillus sp. FSL R10-2199 TaxID=2975348 RepID=UPI0030FA2FED
MAASVLKCGGGWCAEVRRRPELCSRAQVDEKQGVMLECTDKKREVIRACYGGYGAQAIV